MTLNILKKTSILLAMGCFFIAVNARAQSTGSFNPSDGISNILLPNVFTPNGDSINDVFMPLLDEIAELDYTIYNRDGIMIFESLKRLRAAWDGRTTSGEPCCDGTYFCVVNATGIDGKTYKEKVALQLITNQFFH